MKKKVLCILCTIITMSVGSTIYAADFSDGEPAVSNVEEAFVAEEIVTFDDGYSEVLKSDFADAASSEAISVEEIPAEDVPIDEEHFPCKAFREVLSQKSYDRNTNGILEEAEIKEITSFSEKKYDPDGFYMEGYQYLTSLEHLDLYFKYYTKGSEPDTALELDFSTLPNLRSLYVDVQPSERVRLSGKILSANLDLSENKKLTDLNLSCGVAVRELPKDCNIKNYTMSCWDLDYEYPHWHSESDQAQLELIRRLPRLEEISIETGGRNVELDTSLNPELKKLKINGWRATITPKCNLDVTANHKLTDLELRYCNLANPTLDLSQCPLLENFTTYLVGLPISEPFNVSFLDLVECYAPNVSMHLSRGFGLIDLTPGGYITLDRIPNGNPDRIKEVEYIHMEGNRLYPLETEDTRDRRKITYYADKNKTIPITVELFFLQDVTDYPEMVTGLEVTEKTATSLSCKWNPVKRKHTGYVVYVQDSRTDKTIKRVTLNKSSTSATITGLKPGYRYKIVVRAYRKFNGKNIYSPHYKGYVFDYTKPKTPSPKVSLRSDRRVKLTWKASPAAYHQGNSQYVIYYRNTKSKHYQRLTQLPDKKESYTTKVLKKENTYYFRMRSIISDKDGKHRTYGDFSKTVKVTIK